MPRREGRSLMSGGGGDHAEEGGSILDEWRRGGGPRAADHRRGVLVRWRVRHRWEEQQRRLAARWAQLKWGLSPKLPTNAIARPDHRRQGDWAQRRQAP